MALLRLKVAFIIRVSYQPHDGKGIQGPDRTINRSRLDIVGMCYARGQGGYEDETHRGW
jgi:hypothetical protein